MNFLLSFPILILCQDMLRFVCYFFSFLWELCSMPNFLAEDGRIKICQSTLLLTWRENEENSFQLGEEFEMIKKIQIVLFALSNVDLVQNPQRQEEARGGNYTRQTWSFLRLPRETRVIKSVVGRGRRRSWHWQTYASELIKWKFSRRIFFDLNFLACLEQEKACERVFIMTICVAVDGTTLSYCGNSSITTKSDEMANWIPLRC